MAGKKLSERFATHKIGASSFPSAVAVNDLIILQDTSEANADNQVKVVQARDLIEDYFGKVVGKNLFDKNNVLQYYIINAFGAVEVSTNVNDYISHAIPVTAGQTLVFSTLSTVDNRYIAFYTAGGVVVGSPIKNLTICNALEPYVVTVPETAVFMVVTVWGGLLGSYQIEVGSEKTAYVAYSGKISESKLSIDKAGAALTVTADSIANRVITDDKLENDYSVSPIIDIIAGTENPALRKYMRAIKTAVLVGFDTSKVYKISAAYRNKVSATAYKYYISLQYRPKTGGSWVGVSAASYPDVTELPGITTYTCNYTGNRTLTVGIVFSECGLAGTNGQFGADGVGVEIFRDSCHYVAPTYIAPAIDFKLNTENANKNNMNSLVNLGRLGCVCFNNPTIYELNTNPGNTADFTKIFKKYGYNYNGWASNAILSPTLPAGEVIRQRTGLWNFVNDGNEYQIWQNETMHAFRLFDAAEESENYISSRVSSGDILLRDIPAALADYSGQKFVEIRLNIPDYTTDDNATIVPVTLNAGTTTISETGTAMPWLYDEIFYFAVNDTNVPPALRGIPLYYVSMTGTSPNRTTGKLMYMLWTVEDFFGVEDVRFSAGVTNAYVLKHTLIYETPQFPYSNTIDKGYTFKINGLSAYFHHVYYVCKKRDYPLPVGWSETTTRGARPIGYEACEAMQNAPGNMRTSTGMLTDQHNSIKPRKMIGSITHHDRKTSGQSEPQTAAQMLENWIPACQKNWIMIEQMDACGKFQYDSATMELVLSTLKKNNIPVLLPSQLMQQMALRDRCLGYNLLPPIKESVIGLYGTSIVATYQVRNPYPVSATVDMDTGTITIYGSSAYQNGHEIFTCQNLTGFPIDGILRFTCQIKNDGSGADTIIARLGATNTYNCSASFSLNSPSGKWVTMSVDINLSNAYPTAMIFQESFMLECTVKNSTGTISVRNPSLVAI